ncbi:MAG: MBL fold metallo-hydrolase [Actinomycetota bacterium]|nr:MBL fold metallo-hydrolase [Actinomycetota bacterium]
MSVHPDPIRNVTLLSTGTVDIHPEHAYGSKAPTYWWILTSRRWLNRRPINVFVIEHRDGLVLFDTGQDRASVTDPRYFPRGPLGWLYERLARFDIQADQTLPSRLNRLGYATNDIRVAVLSHLHQDHIGGLPHLEGARIVTSSTEHAQLTRRLAESRGVLRRHVDLPGLDWDPVHFEALDDPDLAPFTHGVDLMGDRSMILLPTPGHTPGSLSMLVRRPGYDPVLMVGDLTYDAHAMEHKNVFPGVGSTRALKDTTSRVLELKKRHPGLRILAAHDPAAAAALTSNEHQHTRTIA